MRSERASLDDGSKSNGSSTLPSDEELLQVACRVPLKPPGSAEGRQLDGSTASATDSGEPEDGFTAEPVQVDHGVALLEESVELGVPDVVTQA